MNYVIKTETDPRKVLAILARIINEGSASCAES